MSDIETELTGAQAVLDELIASANAAESVWTTPRAPGKWSPSQLSEHVARSLDEGAKLVAGQPSRFPSFPFFVRPIVRGLFFKRVLRGKGFPKAKTFDGFDPEAGPATPADARSRLQASLEGYAAACRECAEGPGVVTSGAFGKVSVADYTRFQAEHIRHHLAQMPAA